MDMGGTDFLTKGNETPERRTIISAVIALLSILVAIRSPLEENNGAEAEIKVKVEQRCDWPHLLNLSLNLPICWRRFAASWYGLGLVDRWRLSR
jgi:hypothetical protein